MPPTKRGQSKRALKIAAARLAAKTPPKPPAFGSVAFWLPPPPPLLPEDLVTPTQEPPKAWKACFTKPVRVRDASCSRMRPSVRKLLVQEEEGLEGSGDEDAARLLTEYLDSTHADAVRAVESAETREVAPEFCLFARQGPCLVSLDQNADYEAARRAMMARNHELDSDEEATLMRNAQMAAVSPESITQEVTSSVQNAWQDRVIPVTSLTPANPVVRKTRNRRSQKRRRIDVEIKAGRVERRTPSSSRLPPISQRYYR
ncbi:hypothetical protein HKX48_007509 [Thoreauomyces humboldtii]|nr:hypothetical protein HKX48_007509 [Thoreauomyces humboldtii]